MIARLTTTFACILVFSASLFAQKPENIRFSSAKLNSAIETFMCDTQNAGTVQSITAISAQSNDIGLGTTFLCLGDEIRIDHANDFDLAGSTPFSNDPGIAYAFLDCPPTATGPSLMMVLDDPCINTKSPILFNGNLTYQTNGIWVAADEPNGDANFINDGNLLNSFTGGREAKEFWFAPITVDSFARRSYFRDPGTNEPGPCINMRADEAFSVVYLAPIETSNLTISGTNGNCTGSFEVRGGFPEFVRTEDYTITIQNRSTASVGTITSGSLTHGSTIEFTVPEVGNYEITVEDGKSCSSVFRMDFFRCNGIKSYSTSNIVEPGNTVCVDIVVDDFDDIGGMQYTLQWDPTVLEFDRMEPATPAFPGLDPANPLINFGDFRADGQMTLAWNSPNVSMGFTAPPGTVVYRVCFRAIGQLGEFSDIQINGSKTNMEVVNGSQVKIGLDNSTVGRISITNSAIDLQFVKDTACHLGNNGGLEIFPVGGTPPYQITYREVGAPVFQGPFVVNTVGGSIPATGLTGGSMYEVNVEDSSTPQEMLSTTVEMTDRPELEANVDPVQEISCPGDADGVLIANVFIDGVRVIDPGADFQFSWLPTGEQTRVISNLPSQRYFVTVTDAFGCEGTGDRRLETPEIFSITGSTTTASCSGVDDGGLTFDVLLGGVLASSLIPAPNFDIAVTGPTGLPVSTRRGNSLNVSTGLIAGRYDINIMDDSGCSLDTFLMIDALKTLTLSQQLIDNVRCDGNNDGRIFIEGATVGAAASLPYTFTWIPNPPIPPGNTTNTDETSTISMLSVGSYNIRMSDTDGCELDTTFMITAPNAINIVLVDKMDETCAGGDGSIEVRVTGGTAVAGYTFDWGIPGQTTNVVTGLTAGNYSLMVTDDNSCSGMFDFTIGAASPPLIVSFPNDTLDCSGDSDGILEIIAAAGSSPIGNYEWSTGVDGTTLTSLTNLAEGEYIVTVTSSDPLSPCSVIDTAYVISPDPLVIDDVLTTAPICPNTNTGLAIASVSGGTPGYTFFWSNNPASPSGPVLDNLIAGDMLTVRVVDSKGCNGAADFSFTVPAPLTVNTNFDIINPVSCFGTTCDGEVTAFSVFSDGSAGPFSFEWSSGEMETGVNSSTASTLCQGNQTVTITDSRGCETIENFEMTTNEPLSAMVDATPVSCFGLADGDATVTMSGGEGPFTYDWLNAPVNSMDATVTLLPADTFFVEIADVNGCQFSTSVIITEPDEFMVEVATDTTDTKNVKCPGGDDGQITIIAIGGNQGNLTYNWDPSVALSSSPIASDLTAGTYAVTVTDASNCTASTLHTITAPPPITFVLDTITPIQCFGFSTVVTLDTVFGGNPGSYAYSVNGAQPTDISFPANVFAGTYPIEVFDSRNCSIDSFFTVTQPNPVSINIDPVIEVELGDSVQLRPQFNPGGVPINPDSIFWEPAEFLSCDRCPDPIVRPFADQFYTITAYDINGCPGFAEVLIEVDKNRNIFLPNAFSPNGDGVNDEFRVFTGVGVQKVNYVHIFDRWGNILYADTDIEPNISGIPTWDGFYKGKPLDPGVFIYLVEVEFEDGLTLLYRGDLTLLR